MTDNDKQKRLFDRDRWAMQNQAAKLLKGHRVSFCLRSPIRLKDSIKVVRRSPVRAGGDVRYGFTGTQCCGSVHGCPMCSSRIALHRENEVRAVSDWAKKQGHLVGMLTLTHPHQKYDILSWQLEKLNGYCDDDGKRVRGALYHFRNSRAFRSLKLVGDIRKFEATHGKNGWHPHHHIMFIVDQKKVEQFNKQFNDRCLFKAWVRACEKVGLDAPSSAHGMDFQFAENDTDISAYISKMGSWDMSKEMTKDQSKKSRDGDTQWQLLRKSKDGCKKSGSLFVEYVEATKGLKSLVFSRGLKAKAFVDDVSDNILAEDVSSVESIVFDFVTQWLNFHQKDGVLSYQADGLRIWYLVLTHGSRYRLLHEAKMKGRRGCYDYIRKLALKHHMLSPSDLPLFQPVKIRRNS